LHCETPTERLEVSNETHAGKGELTEIAAATTAFRVAACD